MYAMMWRLGGLDVPLDGDDVVGRPSVLTGIVSHMLLSIAVCPLTRCGARL